MATMRIYEATCEETDENGVMTCTHRATREIIHDNGDQVGFFCTAHSGGALKRASAVDRMRADKREKARAAQTAILAGGE